MYVYTQIHNNLKKSKQIIIWNQGSNTFKVGTVHTISMCDGKSNQEILVPKPQKANIPCMHASSTAIL
jgi:hypothetical protein